MGSLLVTAQDDPHRLVGIFTERDLLRWIDDIQHGGHWDKPVAHLMSRPVRTIAIEKIDEAASLMLQHSIRHLPVTQSGVRGTGHLIGVVSMRDLLARELEFQRSASPRQAGRIRKRRIVYAAPSGPAAQRTSKGLQALAKASLPSQLRIYWKDLNAASLQNFETPSQAEELTSADLLILDVDGVPAQDWARLLRKLNLKDDSPSIILLFSNDRHSDLEKRTLLALSRSGKWPAFEKPLRISAFQDALVSALAP